MNVLLVTVFSITRESHCRRGEVAMELMGKNVVIYVMERWDFGGENERF